MLDSLQKFKHECDHTYDEAKMNYTLLASSRSVSKTSKTKLKQIILLIQPEDKIIKTSVGIELRTTIKSFLSSFLQNQQIWDKQIRKAMVGLSQISKEMKSLFRKVDYQIDTVNNEEIFLKNKRQFAKKQLLQVHDLLKRQVKEQFFDSLKKQFRITKNVITKKLTKKYNEKELLTAEKEFKNLENQEKQLEKLHLQKFQQLEDFYKKVKDQLIKINKQLSIPQKNQIYNESDDEMLLERN